MFKNKKNLLLMLIVAVIVVASIIVGIVVFSNNGNNTSSTSPSSSSSSNEVSKVVNETKLVTYEGPSLLTSSSKVDITVEGQPVFVYETRVNHKRSFTFAYSTDTAPVAIFDFEGRVNVEITIKDQVQLTSAVVRPLAYNVVPTLEGSKISFTLDYSGNYVIEYNNDPTTAIHLFANPLDENRVDPNNLDENTIYIGPGIYNSGAIPIKDNTTVYLDGGAVVYGQIRGEGVNNVTIRGRGILSGEIFSRTAENQFTIPIEFRSSSNITIEGITILDPAGWTVTIYKSQNVEINNLKIITARANGDGLSIQSSSNVSVNGGFVRSWDDSLVVKNVDRGNTKNVVFDGVIVWTDLAQSMEVGYETNGATMDDITFRNITVVHNFHKPAMSIHNCDDAIINNVLYQNITIEDGRMLGDNQTDGEDDYLIDMTVAYNIEWTKSGGNRGKVTNVTFDNIKVLYLEDSIISRIQGESAESNISNVLFKNIKIEDKQVKNADDLKLVTNQYASKISYMYDDSKVSGATINKPYKLELTSTTPQIENVEGIEQLGLIVPDFAHLQGGLAYMGVKAKGTFTVQATHGAGSTTSTPVDDGSGVNELATNPAANLLDGDTSTTWKGKPWTNEDKEFAGLTVEFDVPKYIGSIRILGDENNIFLYETDIQVWGYKTSGSKYTRIAPTKTYELSPQSGNSIDINISATDYVGLQLRIYRLEGFMAQTTVEFGEIEFYPPSLTYNKPIVDASEHADVYPVSKITDGEFGGTSYYESSTMPAHIVVDMMDVYDIEVIVMHLPPVLLWDARTQEIQILVSADNQSWTPTSITFTELRPKTAYTFDPVNGNLVSIELETPVTARYIKLVFASNSTQGGYGAQISELNVYGS